MKTRAHACVTSAPDEQGVCHNDACVVSLFPPYVTRRIGMEHERRRQPAFPVCQPRLTTSLGMAPSTYRRISRHMAPAPIPWSCAVTFRRIVRAEGVAPGPIGGRCNRRWRLVSTVSGGALGGGPTIGAVHRSRQSWEWHLPAIAGFPGNWRRRQLPGPAP